MRGEHAGARAARPRAEEYRSLREELERSIRPLATSLDGRRFTLLVHESVLSQCDNLVLMRMNSTADLARANGFRQGECIVAGTVVSHPTLARAGARVSQEGGAVPASWAAIP